jgi:hypothetical protein
MGIEDLRASHRDRILQLAALHGASNVRVFGSVARGDTTPASDLDLLVDLAPRRSLLDLIRLQREVSELLGASVDVVSSRGLRPAIRQRVLAEAVPL